MLIRKLTRRDFVVGAATAAGSITAAAALAACGKKPTELSCTDDSALAAPDKSQRQAVKYVDRTADPAKPCEGCVQFNAPPNDHTCGGCKVVKGPIHPKGYCTLWVKKPG